MVQLGGRGNRGVMVIRDKEKGVIGERRWKGEGGTQAYNKEKDH